MELSTSFALAWRALRRNGLRSALTLLGITIGVGAVLTMVAVGNGARASIEDQVAAAGMNVITVTAGNYKMKGEDPGGGVVEHQARLDLNWLDGRDGPRGQDRWTGQNGPDRRAEADARGFGFTSAVYRPTSAAVFRLIGHPEDDPMEKHDHPTSRDRLCDSASGGRRAVRGGRCPRVRARDARRPPMVYASSRDGIRPG